jgi:anaerobic magnesium-protoporphyrin IX monomethyl ester cyclase
MDICLIRPPILIPKNNITALITPPLGLAYIAGSLREAGHRILVIDGLGEEIDGRHPAPEECVIFGMALEEIVERIPATAEIIALSAAFSFEWPLCKQLLELIRHRFPNVTLVAGGEHITAMPEMSLRESALDIAVLGEGEETSVALAAVLAGERAADLAEVEGIAFLRDGRYIETEKRKRIREIDEIPWPAWDLFPIRNYLDRQAGFGVRRGRSMPVLASRGCPYQCTFCSSPNMWTTRWLARSPESVLKEIAYYQKEYNAQNFDFYDLTMIVKRQWILDFCALIEEKNMEFTWQLPSGTRSEALDCEVAAALYRSGCRNLSYSPESGSISVLKRIKKKIKPAMLIDSIRAASREGLNIKTNIMFGFPGETILNILESYKFIMQMAIAGAHDLSIWAFSPYPGSELFNYFLNNNSIEVNDAYFYSLRSYADVSYTKSYSEHISDKNLTRFRSIGTLLFYVCSWCSHPSRPFRIVANILRGRQESRSEMVLEHKLHHILGRFRKT